LKSQKKKKTLHFKSFEKKITFKIVKILKLKPLPKLNLNY